MNDYLFAPPSTDLCPHLPHNERGRAFVVGDIHGHFDTLRHALAELEVGEHDRVLSLGDLVDRGPHYFEARERIEGIEDRNLACGKIVMESKMGCKGNLINHMG